MDNSAAVSLAQNIANVVVNPLIALLFAVGLLVFVLGIVEYIFGLSSNSESRENGKRHMLWGIVGMFVMAGSWSIFKLIVSVLGAEDIL